MNLGNLKLAQLQLDVNEADLGLSTVNRRTRAERRVAAASWYVIG
jgi:hypothetical protein